MTLAAAIAAALHLLIAFLASWIPTPQEVEAPGIARLEPPLDSLPTIAQLPPQQPATAHRQARPSLPAQHRAVRSRPHVAEEQPVTPAPVPAPAPSVAEAPAPQGVGVPVPGQPGDTARPAELPGGRAGFTSAQDSAYARGKRDAITRGSRFHGDIERNDSAWAAEQRRIAQETDEIIKRNLTFTPEELSPSQRDRDMFNRQMTPGRPQNISPNIPRAGISIPFSMGGLLGYEPDVSPRVSYTIYHLAHVRVTVLSMRGDTLRVMFDGMQTAGSHAVEWDGRTDEGSRVPPGDYVVEVTANDVRVMMKWVKV